MPLHLPKNSCTFRASPDVLLHCERYGNEDNSPIIFLHGFGASIETWRDVLPLLLTPPRSVCLVDLKGFGQSSKPRDGAYSLEEQADLIISMLESRKLSGVTLVGHSYGGAVALLVAIRTSHYSTPAPLVGSLILLDAAWT